MTKGKMKLGTLVLVGILMLSACSAENNNNVKENEPSSLQPAVEEPIENPDSTSDNDMGQTTLKGMKFDQQIDNIKSIILKDVEGNDLERTFTKAEIEDIRLAFNDSFIMDTAYIEMITGYNMTIILENEEEIFVTSYGDPVFIVARVGDGATYHLGCELIASILLEETN